MVPDKETAEICFDKYKMYEYLTQKGIKTVQSYKSMEQFEKALRAAKEFADRTGVSLITINSWNEWTETSYLEPDSKYGYGYLQAVKKVFSD